MTIDRDIAADKDYITAVGGQLAAQVDEYADSLDENRRLAFSYKKYEFFLGAVTTVVIGLSTSKIFDDETHGYLSVVALITSSVVTIVTGLESFRGYRDNWVRYATTWSALRMIRADFERRTAGGQIITQRALQDIVDRFEQTLRDSHSGWGKERQK